MKNGIQHAVRGTLALVALCAATSCSSRDDGDVDGGPGPDAGSSFVLDPAEGEITCRYGEPATLELNAYVLRGDSREAIDPSRWSLSRSELGAIDEAGTFSAPCIAGGRVAVTATGTIDGASALATGTIDVVVELDVPPDPSIPDDVEEEFETTPPVSRPQDLAFVEYPLDGSRMPNNVAAPSVQWSTTAGARGDLYRVTLEGAHVRVTAYAHDGDSSYRSEYVPDTAAWRLIADSARGEEVSVRVDRIRTGSGERVDGTPVKIWISDGGLFGTIYHWRVRVDPPASDVLRIDAARGERQSVFETPSGKCVGCHALSQDGRELAATTDSRALDWVTAIVDTTSSVAPPPDAMPSLMPSYNFLAFSPDSSRILASKLLGRPGTLPTRLALLDGATGAEIAGATGLPTGDAGFPAWSPDGELVAWMDGGGDGTEGTDAATRILIAPVTGADALGEAVVLHDGAALEDVSDEGGVTDSRPTFSPDGRFVAFAHGTRSISSRTESGALPRAGLYLIPSAGGEAVRLDRGMGFEGPIDAFWPQFSPFVTEERDGTVHFWLAFYSRQDYGNVRAGTKDTGRRQLWVMAIDPAKLAAGEDPSFAPYWLPGQDVATDNLAALWAPTACRARDESCTTSSECCSGECAAADPSMPDVLTCRPPTTCRRAGESCGEAGDCCGGMECELGVCGYEPPM